ncbi:MAG: hypothetical protein ABI353_15600 [Isosphaeraceae bacterium]
MRRPRTALIAAVMMTALSATLLGARQLRGQSASPTGATPTIDSTRGVRFLLRNGLDYLDKYQEYDRALVYLREAESRQSELDDAERKTLNQALQRALQGMRAVEGAPGSARAEVPARSRPGTIALAPPSATIELLPADDPVQLVGGGAAVRPEPAANPGRSANPRDQEIVHQNQSVSIPGLQQTPQSISPEPRPEPAPIADQSLAMSAPGEPSPMPAQSGDVTIISAPPEPLDDVLPVIEARDEPELAPLPPVSDLPEPPELPPLTPSPELPTPAERPAPTNELTAPAELATPTNELAMPAELPAPAELATPTELPATTTEGVTTPPELPPVIESEPLVAEPEPVAEPAQAAAAVDPIVPIEEPAKIAARPADLERPAETATVDEVGDLPPLPPEPTPRTVSARSGTDSIIHNSLLSSELQREVEEVAQRLEQDASRRIQQRSGANAPLSGTNDMAGSQLELPRAPSPTEARPLRAIPVPEEFEPLPKRQWDPQRKYWAAAATGHGPLYFQDAALERYGQSLEQAAGPFGRFLSYPLDDPKQSQQRNQFLQPWYSIGKFATQIALLPYHLVVDPPWEAEWDLGYYRPGDRIPPDTFYIPTTGVGPPLRGRNY